MSEQRPLVSVLTPTYNHERFIGPCIESVLSQTYDNWEMLIVDDGSSDDTDAVARSYSDSRVKYIRQKHRGIWGLGETYNSALAQSHGRLIAILEGDDLWRPNRLASQVPILVERPDLTLCYGRYSRVDESGRLLDEEHVAATGRVVTQSPATVLRGLLLGGLTAMPLTTLIRRESLEQIGGFQQPAYLPTVDHPTWLNLARTGPFCLLDIPVGCWRRHQGQTTELRCIELAEGGLRYNIDFFGALNAELRAATGITLRQLQRHGVIAQAGGFFVRGRYLLLRGERRAAVKCLWRAFSEGDLRTKAKAILASTCCVTGVDFESLVSAIGHGRYGKKCREIPREDGHPAAYNNSSSVGPGL